MKGLHFLDYPSLQRPPSIVDLQQQQRAGTRDGRLRPRGAAAAGLSGLGSLGQQGTSLLHCDSSAIHVCLRLSYYRFYACGFSCRNERVRLHTSANAVAQETMTPLPRRTAGPLFGWPRRGSISPLEVRDVRDCLENSLESLKKSKATGKTAMWRRRAGRKRETA